LVNAICTEISLRKTEWQAYQFNTIYLGGGTPSMLTKAELRHLLNSLHSNLDIAEPLEEFTLECNPEDITREQLNEWSTLGVDRLSIGTQSFHDEDLKLMNRNHNGRQGIDAINLARDHGFERLTIDLIFGIPNQPIDRLEKNLDLLFELSPQHFSAYSLTVEPGTLLAHQVQKGIIRPVEESQCLDQYEHIHHKAVENGYGHYEISNYALEGFEAQHNSSYWKGSHYLGLGPSAHSYNGSHRRWNVANNHQYIRSVNNRMGFSESELLGENDLFNEYLITRLRTKWGISLSYLKEHFYQYAVKIEGKLNRLSNEGLMLQKSDNFTLSLKGQFLCDHITENLMIIDDED